MYRIGKVVIKVNQKEWIEFKINSKNDTNKSIVDDKKYTILNNSNVDYNSDIGKSIDANRIKNKVTQIIK